MKRKPITKKYLVRRKYIESDSNKPKNTNDDFIPQNVILIDNIDIGKTLNDFIKIDNAIENIDKTGKTQMKRKPPKKRVYNPTTKKYYPVKPRRKSPTKIKGLWKEEKTKIPKKVNVHKIRIDPLDQLFSLYIRTRDKFTCQRCGVKSKNVQCAHFHGRARKSTRWDEDNCVSLCLGCHQYYPQDLINAVESLAKSWNISSAAVLRLAARDFIKRKKTN